MVRIPVERFRNLSFLCDFGGSGSDCNQGYFKQSDFACKQSQKYVRRGKMNVKSHGFDFSLDMNTLAQGLRKTEPLLFILRYRILRTPINF